jgi:ADP-ribose pyrophosphatase YjhB (NUDIX family)
MENAKITVDTVIFTLHEIELRVLLVRRTNPPPKGKWALPGGFIEKGESLEDAALRELEEETGVRDVYLEQLYTFGDPRRDPRGRVVTVAYFALVPPGDVELPSGSDAAEARWFPVHDPPPLAFDHARILGTAIERLRAKLAWTAVGFKLLPETFTLTELQLVFEAVLGKKLDKRNFRRKLNTLGLLRPLNKYRRDGVQRPARLFRFSESRFDRIQSRGLLFPF